MVEKSSVMFVGRYGLIFTDEDGIMYNVHIEKNEDTGTLLKQGIKALNKDKLLTNKDIEMIISKVLSLTPEIKWEIE